MMAVNYSRGAEGNPSSFVERHQYEFRPFSVTLSEGAAGNLTISETPLNFNILVQGFGSDLRTTLLLTSGQPVPPTPAPSSFVLVVISLVALRLVARPSGWRVRRTRD
jgi:hypothetical protein